MPDGQDAVRPAPPAAPATPVVPAMVKSDSPEAATAPMRQVWVHAAPRVLDKQAYNDLDSLVRSGESCPFSTMVDLLARTPEWLAQFRLVRGEFGLATTELLEFNAARVIVFAEPYAHIISLIDAIRLDPTHPLSGAFNKYSDLVDVLDAMSTIPALWNPQTRLLGYDFPSGFRPDAQSRGLSTLRTVEAHFTFHIDPEVPDADLLERAARRLRSADSVVTSVSSTALVAAVGPLLGAAAPPPVWTRGAIQDGDVSSLTTGQREKLAAMTRLDRALWEIAKSLADPRLDRVDASSATSIELLA
jgi:hypothetical protein